MSDDVYPFECGVKGKDWSSVVYAQSRGKAKVSYWHDIRESWEDIPFTLITARRCGECQPLGLRRTALYRDLPFVRAGMVVKVGGWYGRVVGSNASANLDVLFVDGPYRGQTLNCHPRSEITYYEEGNVIAEFRGSLKEAPNGNAPK